MWDWIKWQFKIGWRPVTRHVVQDESTYDWTVTTVYVNTRTGERREQVLIYDDDVAPWA